MDNKIFNVNGVTKERLLSVLRIALESYSSIGKCPSYSIDLEKGFIAHWSEGEGYKFPVPISVETLTDIVWDWLQSKEAKGMKCEGWDANADHDGSNEYGWRVYVEDWGHIGKHRYAHAAIRPAYIWYGK